MVENHADITANFYSQPDNHEALENRNCLWALHATDPRRDKDRIERVKGGLFEDAYNWVLENADFKQWCDNEESQLLWIKGDPGKGKTMLLCGIINELTKSAPSPKTTIAFFFCQAADARINHATAVIRGLIFMLIDQHPDLISHVRREYDTAGAKVFEDVNAWETLLAILTNILRDRSLPTTYLIIDALDECTTGLDRLLDFIVENSHLYPCVKWLVSSRNWPSIEQVIETAPRTERLWLELNEAAISKAVTSYIHYKAQTLQTKKKYSDDTRDAVSQYLLANAHGTFLWVALVCEEIAKFEVSRRTVRRKLEEFPAGLDRLYQRMLDQIDKTADAELCKSILGLSTVVYRPITLDDLGSYVDLPEDIGLSDLEEIIGLCGSFLTLRGSTILLVHQSAKDFLSREAVDKIFPRGEEIVHHGIFSKSLDVMNRTLRRDIYNLVHPGYPIGQVEQPDPDPLAAIRYACLYWVEHLQMCSRRVFADVPGDFEEGGPVDTFFRNNYLHWLEAISLLRSISEGITSMLKLDALIKAKSRHTALVDRVQDACRFVLYNQSGIRDWPLQVYAAALMFSPEKSITRLQYQAQQPSWILNKPAVEYHWSPFLQALEGHNDQVCSACFSHDSKLIASFAYDHTAKIWDAGSGKCLSTFREDSEEFYSVGFSHDLKLLAVVSEDSIKIWETSSGQCVIRLEGHHMMGRNWGQAFMCVAFFPNSDFLATGSRTGIIKFWNTSNAKSFKILEGHSDRIRQLTFSRDGQLLASTSSNREIKVWDTNSGNCLHTINIYGEIFYTVALSHDSQLLATSLDKTTKLWKTSDWKCLMILDDHGPYITSVTFSHDSKLLASGSADHSIKIWDIDNGTCLQMFQGHQSPIETVVFSHDSQFLASASGDRTIRIWDAKSRQQPRQFDSHSCTSSLHFSHNSRLLASVAEDTGWGPCEIMIWDTQSGQRLQTAKGPRGKTYTFMFSNDLKLFAEQSNGNEVRVWDIKSGTCMQTFPTEWEVKQFFLENPDLKLFDGTVGSTSFSAYGPNALTHSAYCDHQVYGISKDYTCITRNSECLLWLPPEYRLAPKTGGVFSESTLCISCSSGRVLFFTFDSALLSDTLPAVQSVDMYKYPEE
ncbi:hypothetical protein N7457_000276 [Penicillium paradoxum]|uniref:uncharacterized protein n=1 Tax=Penicillium paradoxum TaxID=176176 RepID=UPI0025482D9E|nr:uncharacterized protein N7457_000276 [Penicillium paradoxum]KAJ5793677.1 hypothetical protein N7457_000276 [Penicillium paradoxum]